MRQPEQNRASIGIIWYGGKILLGKKKSSEDNFLAGEWCLPAETAEGDESYEQTLKRGMREELRLEIEIIKFIASGKTPSGKDSRYYECSANIDSLVAMDDLEDAKLVAREDVLRACGEKTTSTWPRKVTEYFS